MSQTATSSVVEAIQTNPLRRDLPPGMTPVPCCMVLFGATGDLARRKIAPALYNLAREGLLPAGFTLLGVARREFSDEKFRSDLLEDVKKYSRTEVSPDIWAQFASGIFYQALRFDEPDYAPLKERLAGLEPQRAMNGNRLYYLATAPEFFAPIAQHLRAAGLVAPPRSDSFTRIVVEKPFGRDLNSARELNARLQSAFDESQIFRIDHYLGKETVQNILALRFANSIFEPLWNRRYVDHVQITVSERVGMEGRRGQYYDHAGALRDMVQNHMMQLLALTAMEPPIAMDAGAIRDEKVKVLRAIHPIIDENSDMPPLPGMKHEASQDIPPLPRGGLGGFPVVRGQYGPGSFAGQPMPGYRQEEGVAPDSATETYVAMRLFVDTWRWSGVPFYLRTGKRMPKRISEIAVQFRSPPMAMFRAYEQLPEVPNQLVLRVQPDEGISLSFEAKVPGMRMRLGQVKMDFRYGSSFGGEAPEAYERLLLDAMHGDPTLFIRADEVDYAWRLMTPLLEYWASHLTPAFPNYEAGTWGPAEADQLIAETGGKWRTL